MFGRKPRDPRRAWSQSALITLQGDFATRKCTVLDLSLQGAKIKIEDINFLKTTFDLKFSSTERVGRHCKVVWRKGSIVGVEFVR